MSTPFAPFEPGPSSNAKRRGKRIRRFQRVPLKMILPNLVTLLALCSGLTAIRMALEARWDLAIGAIVLAAVLDAIDGRVARLLRSTSRFGAELDSLADFVNFGVAPAIILYTWLLNDLKSLGWITVLVFAISAALRLARFNVALDDPDKPAWQGNFFTGTPAPAGALSVLLPVYLHQLGVLDRWIEIEPVIVGYTFLIAFLMVSRLPTFSGKRVAMRVRKDLVLPVFVAAVLLVALGVSYPFEVLSVATIAYLAAIPVAGRVWRKHMLADEDKTRDQMPDDEPDAPVSGVLDVDTPDQNGADPKKPE
ncbi:CDP-diacylglycerol--serine O-phosphatidyltransferase [Breoghania corrubedonensis]|uniref:CDP-diacylglycerol--serine O-phosphatidyltransferase n=1 Tax=Breoghania corrubedonensis TaxID=665038 RepID=A0A2T5VB25_9HYPH|nr:CDP-diacylglycerol--serine O-phosphatidyltransferase [Breoghania corrubedonensis]PTW60946.1 CDP-diacylglycerol--serine O-phosphatidyltransferase [Breoghania corrubedonensis]